MKNRRCHRVLLFMAAWLLLSIVPVRANVYATNIKLNGSLTNSWVAPGYPAKISYILNEPATAGVSVRICLGTNILRTFVATNGQPGALAGLNEFLWDGTDARGSNVVASLYTVQITAGAIGYADWTNITDDSTTFTVTYPRGVDVNKNTNSPYYGRVLVGNAGGTQPLGIYKFNADGSQADEGGFSDGGYSWGGEYSPWKIAVGADDKVYVNDWDTQGKVLQFDELISPGSLADAFDVDNYPSPSVQLSGPYITGCATNEQIWMADANTNGSYGLLEWNLQTNGLTSVGEAGLSVVTTTNSALTQQPYDVAVTTNGIIYTIQRVEDPNDPANRLLCFPPWTNDDAPETVATWAIGSGDTNLANAYGVDVNLANSLVAVASRGFGPDPSSFKGGDLSLFSTTDGSLVKRIGAGADHQYTDVAWDRVGNVYALDFTAGVWRAYSPPGTNQATTTCVSGIQALSSLQPPQLVQPVMTNGASFTLLGQSDVTYVIQLSTNLLDWTDTATNFDVAPDRFISLPPTTDSQDFYRAMVLTNN